jgi:hypothetical protein
MTMTASASKVSILPIRSLSCKVTVSLTPSFDIYLPYFEKLVRFFCLCRFRLVRFRLFPNDPSLRLPLPFLRIQSLFVRVEQTRDTKYFLCTFKQSFLYTFRIVFSLHFSNRLETFNVFFILSNNLSLILFE